MKRFLIFLLALCVFSLAGCKETEPDESVQSDTPIITAQVEPAPLPVITESEAPEAPEPIPIDTTSKDIVGTIVADFTMLVIAHELPEVVPNDEDSIIALRAWMQSMNDLDTYLVFDTANLGMSEYGYCLNLYSPLDFWGNPMCFWIQDTPAGKQLVGVSAGQDGLYTYQGFGSDYSASGFGDDDVRLLEIAY